MQNVGMYREMENLYHRSALLAMRPFEERGGRSLHIDSLLHAPSFIQTIVKIHAITEQSFHSLACLENLMKRLVCIDKHLGEVHHNPAIQAHIHHGYDLIRFLIQKLFYVRFYLHTMALIEQLY